MNPCEGCNQVLKHHYKQRKLDMLIKEEKVDPIELIKESMTKLRKETIIKCVKLALHLIYK